MKIVLTLIKTLTIMAILIVIAFEVISHKKQQQKILVVHSYNKDLVWVNEIDEGIQRELSTSGQASKVQVRYHYMNLKNNPDCNYYKNAAFDVAFTINNWQPDVIIILDDLGQMLVGHPRINTLSPEPLAEYTEPLAQLLSEGRCEPQSAAFFGLDKVSESTNPQIIFAGVNGGVENYGYLLADNVSGIFEHKNYAALVETLITLKNAAKLEKTNIIILNDESPTSLAELPNYHQFSWAPMELSASHNVSLFKDWKAIVKKANDEHALILTSNYQNIFDEEGKRISSSEVISWTEDHAINPVLGANTNFVADGGMISVAISGIEQGEEAMGFALSFIDGSLVSQTKEAKQFTIGLSQSLVRKRNLKLPGIYEAFSREIGQFVPVSEHLYMNQSKDVNE